MKIVLLKLNNLICTIVYFIISFISTINSNAQCLTDFEEIGGQLIIEMESIANDVSGWVEKKSAIGFSGNSYYQWEGGNNFNSPGNGLIEVKFKINNPGTYRFLWRNKVEHGTSSTESNDSWMRFTDASKFFARSGDRIIRPKGICTNDCPVGSGSNGWFKVYSSGTIDWSWSTQTSDGEPHQIYVSFDSIGIYTMQISARSNFHAIDKIVLYQETVQNPLDLNQTETKCLVPAKITQKISYTQIPDLVYTDDTFRIKASTNSGLPLSFTLVEGPANLIHSTLHLTGLIGVIKILVEQNGDSIYHPAVPVEINVRVTDTAKGIQGKWVNTNATGLLGKGTERIQKFDSLFFTRTTLGLFESSDGHSWSLASGTLSGERVGDYIQSSIGTFATMGKKLFKKVSNNWIEVTYDFAETDNDINGTFGYNKFYEFGGRLFLGSWGRGLFSTKDGINWSYYGKITSLEHSDGLNHSYAGGKPLVNRIFSIDGYLISTGKNCIQYSRDSGKSWSWSMDNLLTNFNPGISPTVFGGFAWTFEGDGKDYIYIAADDGFSSENWTLAKSQISGSEVGKSWSGHRI